MKIVIAFVLACTVSACSTVAGVGKDLQGVAEWSKEKMTTPSVDLGKKDMSR